MFPLYSARKKATSSINLAGGLMFSAHLNQAASRIKALFF